MIALPFMGLPYHLITLYLLNTIRNFILDFLFNLRDRKVNCTLLPRLDVIPLLTIFDFISQVEDTSFIFIQ